VASVNLFTYSSSPIPLHSGITSHWKIDCDALTEHDWECLAAMAAEIAPPFHSVLGVPRGGFKFASALKKYRRADSDHTLLVDDVLTTGRSMEHWRLRNDVGLVVFARGKCPDWVTPLFQMPTP